METKQRRLSEFVPFLIRHDFIRFDETQRFVQVPERLKFEETIILRRWRLLVMATNLPSIFSSWLDRVEQALTLVNTVLESNVDFSNDTISNAIRSEIILRLHTSMLLSERYDIAERLLELLEHDDHDIVLSSRLARHRLLQDNSQSFSPKSLNVLMSQNRSVLPLEDRVGLTVELGLYYHGRGMHGEASREFDSILDDLVQLVNSHHDPVKWIRVGGGASSDTDEDCEIVARETDGAVFYFRDDSDTCVVIRYENAMSFLLHLNESITRALYRVQRNTDDVARVVYAATDNLGAIGAIRLFQGRVNVAEQFIRGSVRWGSSTQISRTHTHTHT